MDRLGSCPFCAFGAVFLVNIEVTRLNPVEIARGTITDAAMNYLRLLFLYSTEKN
jgi:hypothetical protein